MESVCTNITTIGELIIEAIRRGQICIRCHNYGSAADFLGEESEEPEANECFCQKGRLAPEQVFLDISNSGDVIERYEDYPCAFGEGWRFPFIKNLIIPEDREQLVHIIGQISGLSPSYTLLQNLDYALGMNFLAGKKSYDLEQLCMSLGVEYQRKSLEQYINKSEFKVIKKAYRDLSLGKKIVPRTFWLAMKNDVFAEAISSIGKINRIKGWNPETYTFENDVHLSVKALLSWYVREYCHNKGYNQRLQFDNILEMQWCERIGSFHKSRNIPRLNSLQYKCKLDNCSLSDSQITELEVYSLIQKLQKDK